ncbi:dienelactone hydrolase family protein [Burkholderia sp. BCC0419]|uniref:poly(ethylene terephthalate) hydrolase family protein n=1 Tax=Burkholderia sp. BCC0419 TaxID=486878 RepID=UPI0015888D6E|nr:dienelactone hydrolase family protein [Burkholderia sp. BCC0419]
MITWNKLQRMVAHSSGNMRGNVFRKDIVLLVLVFSLPLAGRAQSAGGNPYAIGPDPTASSLEASSGPFGYTSTTIPSSEATGYGGGTVYYPTNVNIATGGIVVVPGYGATQSNISWWGPRLASNGFVVYTIDTTNLYDLPAQRAKEIMAAVAQLKTFSTTTGNEIYGKVDTNRIGIMGGSFGGGGTLIAETTHPQLKAAIPFVPKIASGNPDLSKITIPTLIIGCQEDQVAPPKSYAIPYYSAIPEQNHKAYLEISNGQHLCASTQGSDQNKPIIGKYGVAWMKRFVDNDSRYNPYLCGSPHQNDVSNSTVISGYKDTCPY